MTSTIRSHVEAMGVSPSLLQDTDEYVEIVSTVTLDAAKLDEAKAIDPATTLQVGDVVQVRRVVGHLGDILPDRGLFDDDFPGTALGTGWAVVAGTPTVSGGKLHISNAFPQTQLRVSALGAIDPRNHRVEMRGFTTAVSANESGKGRGLRFSSESDPNKYAQFNIYVAGATGRILYFTLTGVTLTPAYVTFDPVAHANLRLRFDQASVYWESSPDATTWTTLQQAALPSWLLSGWAMLYGGATSSTYSDPAVEGTVDRVVIF